MIAAYEKGPAQISDAIGNPIMVRISDDGGLTWSGTSTPSVHGHHPQIKLVTHPEEPDGEELAILYTVPQPFGPGDPAPGNAVHLARSRDLNHFWETDLSKARVPTDNTEIHTPANFAGHPARAGTLPTWAVHHDLVFVAWVRQTTDASALDQIVTTRASYTTEPFGISAALPDTVIRGTSVPVTFQTVNKYFMRVPTDDSVASPNRRDFPAPDITGSGAPDATHTIHSPADASSTPEGTSVTATHNAADIGIVSRHEAHAFSLPLGFTEGVALASLPAEALQSLELADPANNLYLIGSSPEVFQGNIDGNLEKALTLRDALLRPVSAANPTWVQTEYQARDKKLVEAAAEPNEVNAEGSETTDARVLAGFEGAWVYTQGIALHQAVRRHETKRAQGLARWLCSPENAVWEQERILGWPFSKNTHGDTFKDPRLVTGATAWAIHGLGAFLISEAFFELGTSEKDAIRACYWAALKGLEDHRTRIELSSKTITTQAQCGPQTCATLMTAGWTTRGLQHVKAPWALGLTENHSERWAYYDVLDALGYDAFDPDKRPPVRRTYRGPDGQWVKDETFWLNEAQFQTLKERTQAQNVVTEHNLDVLSVLNHALLHREQIWPTSSEQESKRIWLEAWRNDLRRGIFELLWDTPEGGSAIEEKAPNSCRAEPKTITWTGRVITGGEFDTQGRFLANREVAIDNCSWLALSVDYQALPGPRVDQLRQCLHYSIDKFSEHIGYGRNNQCYYGAHYFPNSFRDAYIEQSDQQEVCYHLEATTGLILGLHRFARASPGDDPTLEAEAAALWSGVQSFVRDHGFAYSSTRIQDLFTPLASSTAAIWYLDVYDALERPDETVDLPLKSYTHGVDAEGVGQALEMAWTTLRSLEFKPILRTTPSEDTSLHLLVSGVDEGVAYTRIEDQALGILAAISQGDMPTAEQWTKGLLRTVIRQPREPLPEDWYFPAAVDARTAAPRSKDTPLDAQLWAAYALTRFSAHRLASSAFLDAASDSFLKRVYVAIDRILDTLSRKNIVRSEGHTWLLPGSLQPGRDDSFSVPAALTIHQILAYFVWSEAEGIDLLDPRRVHSSDFSAALRERFWDHERKRPYTALSGDSAAITTPGTAALYSLFAGSVGDVERAEAALDAGLFAERALRELEAHPAAESYPLWVLALRRAKDLDPAMEDVAMVAFEEALRDLVDETTDQKAKRLVLYGSLLLAHHPRGLFGAPLGPNLLVPALFDPRAPKTAGLVRLLSKLEAAHIETLGALFAADSRSDLFDALLIRLTHLRFLESMLEQSTPVSSWVDAFSPEPHIRQTVAELRTLCEDTSPLAYRRGDLERYLGIDCATIVALFETHLIRRGGSPKADMGVLMSSPGEGKFAKPHAHALTHLTAWLLDEIPNRGFSYAHGDAVFGNAGGDGFLSKAARTWDARTFDAPLKLPPGPLSLAEVRLALRARFENAVQETLNPFVQTSSPITASYERASVQTQDAFHPESPVYWQRESVELRAFQEGILGQSPTSSLQFLLRGRKDLPPPAYVTNPASMHRRQVLRQFVHRYAGGHLPRVARKTGQPLFYLHRMLTTGIFFAKDFETIASAYIKDPVTMDTWTSKIRGLDPKDAGQPRIGLPWYTSRFLSGGIQVVRDSAWTPVFAAPDGVAGLDGFSLLAPFPEAVAHVGLAPLEFAKQFGLKEAFRFALFEIANLVAFTGFATEVNKDEINALVDRVFNQENRNVVLVDEGVPFSVPDGYESVGWAQTLPAETGKALYDWPASAIAEMPSHWEDAFSRNIVDNLGFGLAPESRAEAAEKLRAHFQGTLPQNVILKKTGDGVEIYRKLHVDLSWESPRGVVLHLEAGKATPTLIHRQPGSWAQWYEQNVLAVPIPEAHREAYLRVVHAWLLETVLALPGRQSFQERTEEARRRIIGAKTPDFGGLEGSVPTPPPDPKLPGGTGSSAGGDTAFWRGKTIRWATPLPELIVDGLWGLTFSTTDGIVEKRFSNVLQTAQSYTQPHIARFLNGVEITDEGQYPAGVSEWPIQQILRSLPIGTEHDDITPEAEFLRLAEEGIRLESPLRLYTLPSGRLAIHPDDHVTLGAMNLLGQKNVPVRFVLPPYETTEAYHSGTFRPPEIAHTETGVSEVNLAAAKSAVVHATIIESDKNWTQALIPEAWVPPGDNHNLWDHTTARYAQKKKTLRGYRVLRVSSMRGQKSTY